MNSFFFFFCVRSQYDVIFGQYLEFVANERAYMHFYQSCYRYKETIFFTEMDRIAECTSIFERYLSANAVARVWNFSLTFSSLLQVNLPHVCYRDLVKNLFKPDQVRTRSSHVCWYLRERLSIFSINQCFGSWSIFVSIDIRNSRSPSLSL
jgi:hypothetical protein